VWSRSPVASTTNETGEDIKYVGGRFVGDALPMLRLTLVIEVDAGEVDDDPAEAVAGVIDAIRDESWTFAESWTWAVEAPDSEGRYQLAGFCTDLAFEPSPAGDTLSEYDLSGNVLRQAWCRETAQPGSSRPATSFGDGTWQVGVDIQPGIYVTTIPSMRDGYESASGYWARLGDFGGRDVLANAGPSAGSQEIVEIFPDDVGFNSEGCGTWTRRAPSNRR
jgi:hypothetical protein